MTVSSIPNFTPCWLCDNDVNAIGGLFCSEFDTYCCKDHIIDSKTCPVCDCEGVKTPHHMIQWIVESSSENDVPIPAFDIPSAYDRHVDHFSMFNDKEIHDWYNEESSIV